MADNIIKIKDREYPIIILDELCPQRERQMLKDYYAYDVEKNKFSENVRDICHKNNINKDSNWFTPNIVRKYTEKVIVGKCSKCKVEIIEPAICRTAIPQSTNSWLCDVCKQQEKQDAYFHKQQKIAAEKLRKEKEEQEKQDLANFINKQKWEKRELLFKKAIQREKWIELSQSQLDALIDICELKDTGLICKIVFSGDFSNRTIWREIIDPITQRGLMEVETGCKFFTDSTLLNHLKEYELSRNKELCFEVKKAFNPVNDNESFGIFNLSSPYTIYPQRIYSLELRNNKETMFLKIEPSK